MRSPPQQLEDPENGEGEKGEGGGARIEGGSQNMVAGQVGDDEEAVRVSDGEGPPDTRPEGS